MEGGLIGHPLQFTRHPLIASEMGEGAVTTSALSKSLRGFFSGMARALQNEGKHIEAKAFERATAHWLRHYAVLGIAGTPAAVIWRYPACR